MTEFRAMALTMAVSVIAVFVSMAVLTALHASGSVMSLAFLLILVVGADTYARVGIRYSGKQRGR